MTTELPKQYEHAAAQTKWNAFWEERQLFHSEPNAAKKPYTIVIPPPNVTGALHLGHALNNSLQDILVRHKRMQGYNALWMPGTDHAGIATQAVVEKRLLSLEGKTRHDLGREELVQRIWKWKDSYETRILNQLKQMGCSCDWARTRFTLDEMCTRAVRHTFFKMFADGLIYRGKRLVNWDTYLQTAVSDDEVNHEEVAGHFWHFRYPVIDPQPGEPEFVTIATTRPETMLGDTAVAVHPDPATALDAAIAGLQTRLNEASEKERALRQAELDEAVERKETKLPELIKLRDMALAGRKLRLPLLGREIPLVADEWAKPELGSGCVKITPAHDPNDYEVGKRQHLPMINILNRDGTLNAEAGPYAKLKMMPARPQVVDDLDKAGLLDQVEDRIIDLGHSDRSKTPIEPFLTDQWFVKMEHLAQMAMDAVTDGRVKIFPARYAKGYVDWLSEKRDWPVSRQLWWGHRIPIWYCQATEPELQQAFAGRDDVHWHRDEEADQWLICAREGDLPAEINGHPLQQDDDVLDTWFSSALWPHSTLGWPGNTAEMEYYYPTSALVTSRDIITLWVARMVLTGLYNVCEVPFHEVFIHPKILDGYGEGMSKSKGNGVDPLDVIQKFGADSLRFALAYLTTETQDVKMPVNFECPHCSEQFLQTKENREKPRLKCPKCGESFKTQWANSAEDLALLPGAVISERFEVARNYCNKLWNASRFALMNLEGYTPAPVTNAELAVEDSWLLSRLSTVTQQVTHSLAVYGFSEAARALYDFAWDEFCSFYVEMVKNRLQQPEQRAVAQRVLAYALDTLLRLLHPMIPFLTEEVWQLLGEAAPVRGLTNPQPACESVAVAAWPELDEARRSPQIEAQFACFQGVLGGLREVRSRQNIPPKENYEFVVRCEPASAELLQPMEPYFRSMARATPVGWGPDVPIPTPSASFTFTSSSANFEVFVNLAAFLDVEAEKAKKLKEREKMFSLIQGKEAKLSNEQFISRAPANVVEKERASLAEMQEQLRALDELLASLAKSK